MMKSAKKAAFTILLIVLMAAPLRALALVPPLLPFTGLSVFTFPCTCSIGLWGYYAPLYMTSIPMTGPMVYLPWATIPFLNFLPTIPAKWDKGVFVPAVQACWFYVPPFFCVPIPAFGMMLYVGTGIVGGAI
ncbi:MAG: hypothetical protein WC767_01880 [Candidatus Paceibacterota bacterium]|jgi:hypothetical protein